MPQWGAHFLDTVHYLLDCGFPTSCACFGGVYTWKDEHNFTAPDCVRATWKYPDGFLLTSANDFGNTGGNLARLFASQGMLDTSNVHAPFYSAEGGVKRDGRIRGKVAMEPIPRPDHFLNWLQCIRTGERPHASIDDGYKHAVAVLMAVRSYETGRAMTYDHARRAILPA